MSALLQDIRFALRIIARNPGFSAVAILTLAVALGANTAIFSVVHAILLRPLPFENAEQLVWISGRDVNTGSSDMTLSWPNHADVRAQAKSFSGVGVYVRSQTFMHESGEPELVRGADISRDILPLLGVKPAVGRWFSPEEHKLNGPLVMVISYEQWKSRFGGDPSVVGKTYRVGTSGRRRTVVGVLPQGFQFPPGAPKTDFLMPMERDLEGSDSRGAIYLEEIARLRPGVSIEQAQAEVSAIAKRLSQQYPSSNRDLTFDVRPLHGRIVERVRPALLMLAGAVGAVLLIGCANVANLLLARASARHREISIRCAFGASRWSVVRQLLVESVTISLLAGVLGVLIAAWGLDVLLGLAPDAVPRLETVSMDARVLGFALVLSVLTGIVFGLAPALAATKTDLTSALKEGGRSATESRRRNRVRNTLVVAEIALSLLLLAGAGLLIRSFLYLSGVDAGYDAENVSVMRLSARGSAYKDDAAVVAFETRLLDRLRAIPGVVGVSAATAAPLERGQEAYSFQIVGNTPFPEGREPSGAYIVVMPKYFETLEVPLLRGRDFSPADKVGSPLVIIINKAFADRYFPGTDPIGRRLEMGDNGGDSREIIGIAANIRQYDLSDEPVPTFFVSALQRPSNYLAYMVRAQAPVSERTLRDVVKQLDREQPVVSIDTLESIRGESLATRRFIMILLQTLSILALVLAAVGIYSIMSYTVTQRTTEIGIRIALGSQTSDVLRLILRQAGRLVLAGAAAGVIAAFLGTRVMEGLLYGVPPSDPVTFAAITVVMAGVALLASWIPARRAARVDPLVAIRYE